MMSGFHEGMDIGLDRRGPVSWDGCAIVGARTVTLTVERDGSGYRVDLAPLADGLGPESLVAIGGPQLVIDHADRHAQWIMGKPGRATLTLGLGTSCQASARLRRATTGSAACDDWTGLRAVALACSAVTAPPPLARLRAATCTHAARPLRQDLTAAGCVPSPIARRAERIAECEALLTVVGKVLRCSRISIASKQRLGAQARIVAASAAIDDPAARAELAESCRITAAEFADLLPHLGC